MSIIPWRCLPAELRHVIFFTEPRDTVALQCRYHGALARYLICKTDGEIYSGVCFRAVIGALDWSIISPANVQDAAKKKKRKRRVSGGNRNLLSDLGKPKICKIDVLLNYFLYKKICKSFLGGIQVAILQFYLFINLYF